MSDESVEPTALDVAKAIAGAVDGWTVNPLSEGMTTTDVAGPEGAKLTVVRGPDGRFEGTGVLPGDPPRGITLRLGYFDASKGTERHPVSGEELTTAFVQAFLAVLGSHRP